MNTGTIHLLTIGIQWSSSLMNEGRKCFFCRCAEARGHPSQSPRHLPVNTQLNMKSLTNQALRCIQSTRIRHVPLASTRSLSHKSPSPRLRAMDEPRRTLMSSSQWTSSPRDIPISGFEMLDKFTEIEEETLPTYQPHRYYSAQQGEILNERYQVLAKLGYGVTSTVWLGRDLV